MILRPVDDAYDKHGTLLYGLLYPLVNLTWYTSGYNNTMVYQWIILIVIPSGEFNMANMAHGIPWWI